MFSPALLLRASAATCPPYPAQRQLRSTCHPLQGRWLSTCRPGQEPRPAPRAPATDELVAVCWPRWPVRSLEPLPLLLRPLAHSYIGARTPEVLTCAPGAENCWPIPGSVHFTTPKHQTHSAAPDALFCSSPGPRGAGGGAVGEVPVVGSRPALAVEAPAGQP
jgi:hypothetical protein